MQYEVYVTIFVSMGESTIWTKIRTNPALVSDNNNNDDDSPSSPFPSLPPAEVFTKTSLSSVDKENNNNNNNNNSNNPTFDTNS